ncbi:hypothetical protein, partial [Corynebacterium variabile]|uniref:hypothetical protein n=1 Tax=Corynebacterium variabile TaxID=1727 RepID=UPI0028ADA6B5
EVSSVTSQTTAECGCGLLSAALAAAQAVTVSLSEDSVRPRAATVQPSRARAVEKARPGHRRLR